MSTTQEKILSQMTGVTFQNEKKLKVIPLGGLNEIGQNCTAIEYDNDIIVIDMGAAFPDDLTSGTSLIIPDISYLKRNKEKVRGIIVTHGHFDHFGAIPYLYEDIKEFDFYTGPLAAKLIQEGIADKVGQSKEIKIHHKKAGDKFRLGVFDIELIHVNHSIPESTAVVIRTPEGVVYHSGDFKIDFTPVNDKPIDLTRIAQLGAEGIKLALIESTNIRKAGYSMSESQVGEVLFRIFSKAEGRIFVASFASLIGRIQQVIDAAHELGKRVVIDGRSMLTYTNITHELDFLQIPKNTLIDHKIAQKLPDNQVVVICTGSQGQEMSSMGRMASGTHKFFKLKPGDTAIISSSPIPGNELALTAMADKLARKGVKVITNDLLDVHTSGHGNREEIRTIIELLKPEIHIPIHGNYSFRAEHRDLAIQTGIKRENIFLLENGSIFSIQSGKPKIEENKTKNETIVVDGSDVGGVSNVVMRERNALGTEGFIVIILIVDLKNDKLVYNPDIISRGFIYLKDKSNLVEEIRSSAKRIFESHEITGQGWENGLKKRIRDTISRQIYRETKKNPLIVTVVKSIK